jgi:hypothetical protein
MQWLHYILLHHVECLKITNDSKQVSNEHIINECLKISDDSKQITERCRKNFYVSSSCACITALCKIYFQG